MLYIGVVFGTSAVKLLLMDETGNIHKIVSRGVSAVFPTSGLVRTEAFRGLVCPESGRNP